MAYMYSIASYSRIAWEDEGAAGSISADNAHSIPSGLLEPSPSSCDPPWDEASILWPLLSGCSTDVTSLAAVMTTKSMDGVETGVLQNPTYGSGGKLASSRSLSIHACAHDGASVVLLGEPASGRDQVFFSVVDGDPIIEMMSELPGDGLDSNSGADLQGEHIDQMVNHGVMQVESSAQTFWEQPAPLQGLLCGLHQHDEVLIDPAQMSRMGHKASRHLRRCMVTSPVEVAEVEMIPGSKLDAEYCQLLGQKCSGNSI